MVAKREPGSFRAKLSFYLRRVGGWLWEQRLVREGVFCLLFLLHRYAPEQMDLAFISQNYKLLLTEEEGVWFTATASGELKILTTRLEKGWFTCKNILLWGALQARLERVVTFTCVVLTLEWHNPFSRRALTLFLERKVAVVRTLLKKRERLNGKKWEQGELEIHLTLFYRSSLLQERIVRRIHQAVARASRPEILREAQAALDQGLYPLLIIKGSSGSYWMRGRNREILGLFKPFDEELLAPNNPSGSSLQGALGQRKARAGCLVGETAHHEVAAFLVDQFLGFGLIPRTYYAAFTHQSFFSAREDRISSLRAKKTKYGSFQEFAEGFTPLFERDHLSEIALEEYQLLVVLDMIIGNTDRHANNILVCEGKIAAIDNGLSFPDCHEELRYWYWSLEKFGSAPLLPALADLCIHFPLAPLWRKLKKKAFLSERSLHRMRERIALFAEGVKAGLVPEQLEELLSPPYLNLLIEYETTLPLKAHEALCAYRKDQ